MGATTDKVKGTANEAIGKAKQGIGEAGPRRRQGSHQGRCQQGGRRGQQEPLIDAG
jgi:uncharacterized protein YjbJ (UPF0337 family)